MKTKKLFKEKTIYIKNGDMLDEVKDLIQEPLWGYDETFKDDEVVPGIGIVRKIIKN